MFYGGYNLSRKMSVQKQNKQTKKEEEERKKEHKTKQKAIGMS